VRVSARSLRNTRNRDQSSTSAPIAQSVLVWLPLP
jgi:hypothetical protein